MKKYVMVSLVSVFAALMAKNALADTATQGQVLDHVPSGVYVEGTLGYSSTGAGFDNEYAYQPAHNAGTEQFITDLSNGGLGYNVSLGYQFMNNIGLEIGATQYASRSGNVDMYHKIGKEQPHGHSNVGSVDVDNSRMYDVAGRFSYPLSENADVFAKVGLAYLTRDVSYAEDTTPISNLSGESRDHGLGMLYGAGFEYNFTQHVAWTTSAVAATPFSFFSGDAHTIADTTTPSMFLLSTGVKYTF